MRTLVWFRGKDLRIADHGPLREAASQGEVIPLFVVDPYFFSPPRAQAIARRMQYLVDSLAELAGEIDRLGSRLVLVAGRSVDVVPALARRLRVDRVVAHRWTEPFARERDRRVKEELAPIPFDLHEGETLARPSQVLTGAGGPFSVFSPFSRAFAGVVKIGEPLRAPTSLPALPPLPASVAEVPLPTVDSLGLRRDARIVTAGETAARARLRAFLRGAGKRYDVGRDRLGEAGTSRLSQDLKFGTLSPRAVWTAAGEALLDHPKARRAFLNELVWREFAYHVLWHHPRVLEEPFRATWSGFPYRDDPAGWRAWVDGTTGYPVVDAAARQLLVEGFVHNRARMVSASFLTKHLLIDLRRGEEHYMKLLTDGDWAANDLGWQWSAGCGVDAQPWFRVFNPVLQGEKFDDQGAYVRRYVPEIARLPDRWIHRPWEAPDEELRRAGIVLDRTYPRPIVDHAFARQRFLAAAEGHLRGPGGGSPARPASAKAARKRPRS